jgi:glycosyltransferase involved in cell wall biosynthesis
MIDLSKKTPRVAICIPTYNQAEYISEAIQSCLDQTYPNIEIWISDDCSTDATEEIIYSSFNDHKNIYYHKQIKNLNIAKNNNWLLSQPLCDFILRLDSDDKLHPEFISTLLPNLLTDNKIGYAHSAVIEINQKSQEVKLRELFRKTGSEDASTALIKSVSGYRVAANICLFRKEALMKANFYKEDVNFGEDWDLSIRLAALGYNNFYSSKQLAYYRVWNDKNNYRAKRKLLQLNGCLKIFNNTLVPIFEEKGLPKKKLDIARKKLAIAHSICLIEDIFNTKEKKEIKEALLLLDSSASVKLKIALLNWGLVAFYRYPTRIKLSLKRLVKKYYQKILKQRTKQ